MQRLVRSPHGSGRAHSWTLPCIALSLFGNRSLLGAIVASPTAATFRQATEPHFSVEQLGQLVARELQAEERRANESLFSFFEFQDVNEMNCHARLVYLMNTTINVRAAMQTFHSDILGLAGLYFQLLDNVPEENTWIWLMTTAHERITQKMNAYWSRVVAVALDQHQCLIPQIRKVLLDAVVGWKKIHGDFMEMQWNVLAFASYAIADYPQVTPDNLTAGNLWISRLREWFESYTNQLFVVMQGVTAVNVGMEGGAVRLHHQDEHGSFVTYEFLRRKVFGQWAIDKGLLRGLLRFLWQPPRGNNELVTVADFGAGGGHYSMWLNETGLVRAFAFDGTHQAAELTGGVVQEVNLIQQMELWQTFDWILCLEVGEHVPKQFARVLLGNLRRHAKSGLIMSWSEDWEGIGHVNCLSRQEFVAMVQVETGFVLDATATQAVKDMCEIDYIARTIAIFRAA